MAAVMDDDDSLCFVYQEDPDVQGETRLRDLSIGDPFIFRGERFWKVNNYGWGYGICNIRNVKGEVSHIDPNTRVGLIQ